MPTSIVTTPDGSKIPVNHPEDATDEEIMEFASMQVPEPSASPQEKPETYLEGVQERYQQSEFGDIASRYFPEFEQRMQTKKLPDTPYGPGQATKFDVATTGLSQAARTGGELLMESGGVVTPTAVKELAGDAWDLISASPYGQALGTAIQGGLGVYMDWRKENPQLAEDFETTVDVSSLFSPRPDLLELDKKALELKKAGNQTKIDKEKVAVTGLLAPETLSTIDRTKKVGMLGTETWVPSTDFDVAMIDVVQTVPGIKPYGTVHDNFRILQNHVDGQAGKTDNLVLSQNKKVDLEEINLDLRDAFEDFLKSDVYKVSTKAEKKAFENYVNVAIDILAEEGMDLAGLLAGRRRFDRAVNVNSDAPQNAKELAGRLVRGVFNDYLKRNTKGDELHNLLDQQFYSLSALDRLKNKRNNEGGNALLNLKNNIQGGTGIIIPSSILSVIATASFFADYKIAAALAGAGAVAGAGVGIKRYGKQATLKAMAELLSLTNKAIKKVNNPDQRGVLEADRLVLISMMQDVRESQEEPKDDK